MEAAVTRFVTTSGTSVDLVIGLGSSHLVDSLTSGAFLLGDRLVITPALNPVAAPIVPPLVSEPLPAAHTLSTAFLPTATFDHDVLATTGTTGSALLLGSLAPLGDQFAHTVGDWLTDL